MRLRTSWRRSLSQAWLGIALGMLFAATLVEASNQTTTGSGSGSSENEDEPHMLVMESITFVRVLLGTLTAGLIFYVVKLCWGCMGRRQHRQLGPFHWQVIDLLKYSHGWMQRMESTEADVFSSFINHIPIEGRLLVASPTSAPAADVESSFQPLERLVDLDDWCQTPQAHQLATIIAGTLRKRVRCARLKYLINKCRRIGSGFDLVLLEPPRRYEIYEQVVRSLRYHQQTHKIRRDAFRTSTVEDRLRRRYEAMRLKRDSDTFALEGQRVSSYWQPLELLTHNRVEPGALFLRSTSEIRVHRPIESSMHARAGSGTRDTLAAHDRQRPGGLEERWQPIDLEGLMTDDQTRALLKGEVGAGKTTWCRRLAKIWCESDESTPSWLSSYRYLLLISLGDWSNRIAEVERDSSGTRPERVEYWLTEGVWRYSLDMADAVGYRPPLREVLLVLDGYDEVAEEALSRDSLLGDVLHHLLQGEHAAPNVIVTTRPQVDLGHHGDFVDQARVCRIKGLSKEHQAAFVEHYFGEHYFLPSSGSRPLLLSQAFLKTLGRHSTLKQLQYNPLLLKMMCWLYFDQTHQQARLPRLFDVSSTRLTPFYVKTISALKRRRSIMSSDVPICDRLLKRLAYQRENMITSSRIAEVFRFLELHDHVEQQRLLNVLSVDLGLLQTLRPNSDPLLCHWEFLHKSFQEYYRALAMIDELLSDAVDADSVFNELRHSAHKDGQLGYFLVGLLLTDPDDRAVAVAQSLINRAIDSCNDSPSLKVWTWRLLGEVPPIQRSRIALPPLDVLESLDWLPGAISATGSIGLCDWLMAQVPDADKQTWILWTTETSRTALHEAARNGHEPVCRWLVKQVPEREQLAWIKKVDGKGWTTLHLAAGAGHELICRWLVEQVPEKDRLAWIHQTTDMGWTPLHLAAGAGHESVCRWLMARVSEGERLAWIQKADGKGWTTLHLAARAGHESVCRWLVARVPEEERLAWIQKADEKGSTALHMAAGAGHESVCRWLVEQVSEEGRLAWIQMTTKRGATALRLAAGAGHESVCWFLVAQVPERDREALIQQADSDGTTALHYAARGGHKSVCRWLIEQVPEEDRLVWIQQTTDMGWTPLHLAAVNGQESVCRWLVEQVPEEDRLAWIQMTTKQGATTLHQAATNGHESVCRWLIEQVTEEDRLAWIKKPYNNDWTALHLAAVNGHESVCSCLVDQVPEEGRLVWIQQTTDMGWTPLHLAALNGHESLCRWLVARLPEGERLAWIKKADGENSTALHLAAGAGHESVCRWLVARVPEGERLAWIQMTTKQGVTTLHQAAANGHESICRWLIDQVPEEGRLAWIKKSYNNGWTGLHLAAANGHESVCRWLVELVPEEDRLAWIQMTTKQGATTLHLVAANGHESVCRWLIEQVPEGDRLAWIKQPYYNDWTALHLAAVNGHESVCRWLIEQVPEEVRLAWLQQTSDTGWTPLHLAALNGHESVCLWLVEQLPQSARVNFIQQVNGDGETALDFLSKKKAQRLLALASSSPVALSALVPRPPSRPPRARQTRGRVIGDVAARASGSDSEGDIVGLEETKGEGLRPSA